MSKGFGSLVAALWRSFDLDPPALDAPAPTLKVDGHAVQLTLAPDGTNVSVSLRVGALASGAFARSAQQRQLMRHGLGTLLTNRAALRLAAGSSVQVEAVALAPCREDALPLLRGAIEDVLQLLDLHGPTLDVARPSRPQTTEAFSLADNVIFRL